MYQDTYRRKIPEKESPGRSRFERLMPTSCRSLFISFLAAVLMIAGIRVTLAAAGDLDPTFGAGGLVTTDFSGGNDYLGKIAVQSDGKIVAIGESFSPGKFALARYNADGTLDATFGNGGKVVTVIANVREVAFGLLILPDGNILVSGSIDLPSTINRSWAILRYKSDGSLDTSFGNNGIVMTDFGPDDDQAYGMALQSDGKIVAAGRRGIQFYPADQRKGNVALARYTANGTLDTTFGVNGKVVNDFGQGLESYAIALMIQPDDKIVIAGESSYEFLVARYNRDGALDMSFSGNGYALANFSNNWDVPGDALLQPDGKIVIVGLADYTSVYNNPALARYNPDGSFDQSFGTAGQIMLAPSAGIDAVALQRDGKLVALGTSDNGMMLWKFNRNGSFDTTFGSGGIVNTSFGTAACEASDIALQSDGKIVIGGLAATDMYFQHTDFGLARYLNPQTSRLIPATQGDQ
jgi:uncharacterized delta-60 repeat protein